MSDVTFDRCDVPVLIVGGGPVGLALAADLGWRGHQCLVVEQGDGTLTHPRANAENARTMEFCRRWGIADKVREAGTPEDFSHDVLYLTGLKSHRILHIERSGHGGRGASTLSPERPQRCNQIWLDPILRDRAAGFEGVTVRQQCRFESFVEHDDHVVARVHDLMTDTVSEIRCRYLVACCGGRSGIRQTLGIGMTGKPVLDYNLNLFFRIPNLSSHHIMGDASMYFFVDRTGLWASLVALDGRDLWRVGLRGKEVYENPQSVDGAAILRRLLGRDVPHEMISAVPWVARDLVADSYGSARVFLAGDAAHLNTPSGGFGMNTGLGDAVDLGWKLAAMLEGWGSPGLLGSYEVERRPIALRNVRQAAENFEATIATTADERLEEDGETGETARAELAAWIRDKRTRTFLTDGTALGYRYDPSPICWPDGTPAPEDTIVRYQPSSRPGGRAPHAWLADGRSTLDLFGHGFVLLKFGTDDAPSEPLERALATRSIPLRIVTITDPDIARLYERRLVLVRPDGHVAWRGDVCPQDCAALAARICGADAAPPARLSAAAAGAPDEIGTMVAP